MTDVTVEEGGKAKFLCPTTSMPRNLGKSLPFSVYWTFGGHRLDIIDTDLETESHYTSKVFDGRHVLIISKVKPEDEGEYECVATLGDRSDKAVGRLFVLRPPDPPHDVRVLGCHGNTAEIAWVSGRSNGANITGFTVQFNLRDSPDTWFDFYEEILPDKSKSYVELSPYGTYSFRVLARNEVGTSRPSSVTSRECTTPPDRPDRNPGGVRTKTDKKGYLVIEWEPLHRLSFHGPGFCYLVLWRKKGSLAWNSATVNGTYASRFEQEVDEVYGCFEVQVKSNNDMGEAHQPPYIYNGHSFEAEPLLVVSGFRLDTKRPLKDSTAHFKWEHVDPGDRKMNGKFRGYKIFYWKWDEGENSKKQVYIPDTLPALPPGGEFRGSISDLPAYSTIKVQVVVVNTHYHGPPSDTIDVYTPEGTPTSVQGLFADSILPDSVTLRWLPPERLNGIITGYDISYHLVKGNQLGPLVNVKPSPNTALELQARIDHLKPSHRYRFTIAAKTRAGRGDNASIDVRTANRTGGAVPSGNTIYRAHNDNPIADTKVENSSSRVESYFSLATAVFFFHVSAYFVFHSEFSL
ncbi:neuroglian-like [Physella acuta]|uniref:neuroglian-like n=1 Tax=Physella acuta TaxID=109671 RepID=UPI0027DD22E6|nr:neuroglian-like [Physella acuta]